MKALNMLSLSSRFPSVGERPPSYPLSSMQKAVWLDQLLSPDVGCCNVGGLLEVVGEFSLRLWEKAVGEAVRIHDATRIILLEGGLEPHQKILDPEQIPIALAQVDFSLEANAESLARNFIHRAFKKPFSLHDGLLWKMYWVKVAPNRTLILGCFHHLIFDGASTVVFLSTIASAYNRLKLGESARAIPFAPEYVESINDDAAYLSSLKYIRDADFWSKRLKHWPALLFAGKSASVGHTETQKVVWNIPRDDFESLQTKARSLGFSASQMLMAAVIAYFARMAGDREQLVLGMPVHNRRDAAQRATVGMFSSVLPLSVALDYQSGFGVLMAAIANEGRKCYRHQRFPLYEIQRQLRQQCSPEARLFDIVLSIESFDVQYELTDVDARMCPIQNSFSDIPITIHVCNYDKNQDVSFEVFYNPQILKQGDMEAALQRIERLLRAGLDDPAMPLYQLPLLAADERRKILRDFNATTQTYPQPVCLQQLVELQARAQPDALAVMSEGLALTYGELNRRANQLAHHLIAFGVKPDSRVAIALERGLDLVTALLATWKAGGAYVPLDASYPQERLRYILSDSAPQVLVTNTAIEARLGELPNNLAVIRLSDDTRPWESLSSADIAPNTIGLTPNHLAYVIYTSGSTGLPKGVMVEHRQLGNLIHWHCEQFELKAGDRSASLAAIGFDAATWEIWPALCSGGVLVCAPAHTAGDPVALLDWWQAQELDVSFLPTPLAEIAMKQGSAPKGLRTLLIGGDRLRHKPQHLPYRLINNYGPTETAVVATSGVVDASADVLDIGRPIANTQIYILDSQGNPAPVGVVGEIYIGGTQIARGYLNRPDLTEERFLTDPFAANGVASNESNQARMYKTGDLARWLPDGRIDYIGRNDDQVKVRGFRIELGEIEARLGECADVSDAAVLALDIAGDKRLVAYFTGSANQEQLKSELASMLPEYMVPSAFIRLDSMPLTPNGKLDRKALPKPESDAFGSREFEAPQGELEEQLAHIWQELLGIERVGRHDHFFELGGHSLLAVQLIARLKQLGHQLQVRDLFTTPTLAALAATLSVGRTPGFVVPANLITPNTTAITPELLPLVNLEQHHIDRIVAAVPGGIANVQDIYPLALLQEGILFHHLVQTEGDAYLLPAVLGFDSRERLDSFVNALRAVIARHDILRTAFAWENLPEPVQIVWRNASLILEEVDLDTASEGQDAVTELLGHFNPDTARLDIRRAPLLRAGCAEDKTNNRWLLCLLNHHLISDHTTLELMVEEVQAHVLGQQHLLPTPLPFRNFVAQTRLGVNPEEQEKFFRDMLGDIDEPTAPFGLIDADIDASRVHELRLPVAPELGQRLRAQAKRLGVSVASLFHLVWAQVLGKTTGKENVVFGTVLFGRMGGSEGAERALGTFINTLPVRLSLADRPIIDAVRDTHQRLAELLHVEHTPLVKAQRASGVPAQSPLFTTLFNYRYAGGSATLEGQLSDSAWTGMEALYTQERTNYPLTFAVDDGRDFFTLWIAADERIGAQRISHFVERALNSLVDALDQAPHTRLTTLDTLPQAERATLTAFNANYTQFPVNSCVHQWFEQQAHTQSESIGLVYENQTLSYNALNKKANQLAHYLIQHGVKPDSRVAIALERGLDLIVAILATLKAGGAYVPVDPSYASDRLRFILEDSAPQVLITQTSAREALGDLPESLEKVALDDQSRPWELQRDDNIDPASIGLTPNHLAYMIYTSGSTGLPKGVMVEHRQVARLFTATEAWYEFSANDVWTLFHSYGFDFSVWEIWGALLYGGRLVIVPQAVTRSPQDFYELLCREGVTVLNQTPSAFAHLINAQQQSTNEHQLRAVIFGGEALPVSILEPWYERNGERTQLINMYGITETTVHVTYYPLSPKDTEQTARSPIGKAIPDLRLYILDQQGNPLPVGVTGELYVGGAGVARGYWNRPELTQERFIADPFAQEENARLYKTGDVGRWLADGTIEYLGRNDDQVKIRGFRIELGEIEAKLAECAGVREAAVLAVDMAGDKRLVAYYTAKESLTVEQLRAHLSATLPEYMVPSAYIHLNQFPLTGNGKLDRKSLPKPDSEAFGAKVFEAPQGELEIQLAQIWQELLGIERVGRHDHFFELGGHSLLALQLLSRVRSSLDSEVALTELFNKPVLCDFAAAIQATERSELAAIESVDLHQPQPLSFAQQRLWFIGQLEAGASQAYVIAGGLRLRGILNVAVLQQAMDAIVDRHAILRTCFLQRDGIPLQQIRPADIGFALEHRQAEGRHIDSFRPVFDLEHGPLIQGRLVRINAQHHVLQMAMHHIIADGWSMGVLIRELSELYSALIEDRLHGLPAPSIQYADFAAWQRQWLSGDRLQQQQDYWVNHLRGAPALLELPTDHRRPVQQSYAGANLAFTLDVDLSEALRALSRRHGATLFMTLFASWSVLLSRLSGQGDIVIGTPIANRTRAEIESLIGMFVNTQALRVDLSANPTVKELLAQIKATALAAQAHQDIPFEQVVEALDPPRTLAHSPIFQVMFNWQNAPAGELHLPGLIIESLASEQGQAHFDLTLSLGEVGGLIGGSLNYATSLFEAHTIERFFGYWQQVLRAMVADASQTVQALPLLSNEEREVLASFNANRAAYADSACLQQLIEHQAFAQPEAIAVSSERRSLSFGDLNRRANQLAHHLIGRGVQPDSRVAIALERDVDLVVAILATWKAGGAYVPLDPSYPQERLRYILEDSSPQVLITRSDVLRALRLRSADASPRTLSAVSRSLSAVEALCLDDTARPWESQSADNIAPASIGLAPSHLAYLIYTSGSTGLPKGVMVEHRQAINLWAGLEQRIYAGRDIRRVSLNASIAFDASMQQLVQLASGRTLVLIPDAIRGDGQSLWAFIAAQGIEGFDCTPTQLEVMRAAQDAPPSPPKVMLVGGEAIGSRLWQQLSESRETAYYNVYGPTECTVDTTAALIAAGVTPHIGTALDHARIYILDTLGQPVPIGVTGEIYIGGNGVARGYWNRPELTQQRFLSDPMADAEGLVGARMYKTGDVGRWLADGSIEYLGRNDDQVKIRGFRIELGEIEARLAECLGVRDAAVLALDIAGDKRLVAYYTGAAPIAVEQLRAQLGAVLPEYMVPSACIHLENFPLTGNGKLDRRALPKPDDESFGRREYSAPQGEYEELMAAIWQELLGLERVGRDDHFFELGGHSLLAVQLIARLKQRGCQLQVRNLFTTPTLAALAATLADDQQAPQLPENGITSTTTAITPDLLSLVNLEQSHIDRIVAGVQGGAANVQDIYPLAPLQEGILFHHLMHTEGDAYLLPTVLGFKSRGALDGFVAALRAVIARHDILRTAFAWEDLPEPVQVVWRNAPLAVEEIGLESIGADAVAELLKHFDPDTTRLDIRRAPLLRAGVAEDKTSQRWLLCLFNHHLISDHTTLELIVEEVQAHMLGRQDRLPEPLPFRNFVAQTRLGANPAEQDAFFRAMLADIDEPTAPFGLVETDIDSRRVQEVRLPVEALLGQRLRAQAKRLGVSVASLFHLVWAQVLSATTGREDVVFGTVLFGRMSASEGAERALGTFINTLPLRLSLSDCAVEDAVRATHQRLAELLHHEHTPLVRAQRCSGVPAQTPLFTSLINYRYAGGSAALPGDPLGATPWGELEILHNHERTNYPLALSVDDSHDNFALAIAADPRIGAARIGAFVEQALASLIDALEFAPTRSLTSLQTLPAAESALLASFSAGDSVSAGESIGAGDSVAARPVCMQQLVEYHAHVQPDAIAVTSEGGNLSYSELNRRANRLAQHLIALGVQPDSRVAIALERGCELMVALLATWKAGGAYVPLDSSYPQERLLYILEDSAPQVLITQSSLRDLLGELPEQVVVVTLDSDSRPWQDLSDVDIDPLALGLTPSHLAYVIYTSGSTGLPKGVMVEHRTLHNMLSWQRDYFDMQPGDRSSSLAALGFDAAAQEIWAALCLGGTLVCAPAHTTGDPEALLTWWQSEAIDVCFMPTPLAEVAMKQGRVARGLRGLMIGGDRLRYQPAGLPYRLANGYGPTETTIAVTACAVNDSAQVGDIGRPIANTRIYILDRHGNPAPIGVAGEMYIGGAQVARGYLNRPDLTAERFLADPFVDTPVARMYRTGDLARWLPNGHIEYLGRNDDQIKIRGYRIELGEIETQLSGCGGVVDAVVVAREVSPGDFRLVAYYSGTASADNLKAELSALLPAYMVPSLFIALAALPLTPNGKLDRKALPTPDVLAFGAKEYAAPQGEFEMQLAAIWAELLGLERIGRHDNFFELGGHSLLAVQLLSRLRSALAVEVALTELFSKPVLCDFAALIHATERNELAAIKSVDLHRPQPLSFAQQRLWFIGQLEARANQAYVIAGDLRLRGTLDVVVLQQAMDALLERHAILRTCFIQRDGIPLQQIRPYDIGFVLEYVQVETVSIEPFRPAFDLEHGPLIQGRLVRIDAQQHVLQVAMHHIVADGWSMSVLTRELSELYSAFAEGLPSALPKLAIQYVDFAVWQRQWLSGERLQRQQDYWLNHLRGAPELLELPTDRARPALQSFAGASLPFALDAELADAVRALSRRHGSTLFMTLFASWSVFLSRLSGQDDLVIGTPVANRTRADIEPLIGMFVNTQALRVDLSANPTVAELLAQIKATALAAQAHQDIPFEQVVEALDPPRTLAHSPIFQVMFNWQNAPAGELRLPGLTIKPIESPQTQSHFDLTLALSESDGVIGGYFNYATSLFEAATIERFLSYWQQVLRAMVMSEQQAVQALPLMSSDEHQQLLLASNAHYTEFPVSACLQQWFEQEAAAAPQTLALVYENQTLRYGELNRRANQLAHHLIELGVVPDSRVAIALERGPDLIVAILATLKAGGAYVPVDPSYASERLRFILEDSAPQVLITQASAREALGDLPESLDVLALDDETRPWELQRDDNIDPASIGLTPNHLAYMIYTSGSTGLPKGVMVEHRQVARLFTATEAWYDFSANDVWTLFHSYGFDFSVWEIWGALLYGGRLVIVPQAATRSPQDFYELLCSEGVTVLNQTPSAFAHLINAQQQSSSEHQLRTVIFGGEALPVSILEPWYERNGERTQLINMYGITETTVHVTYYPLSPKDTEQTARSPIGRAIPDLRLYILDKQGNPLPVGVTGELYVGGAGVARGYWNRPELTQECFIADPFARANGDDEARLYKTGDVGRWLADGTIDYLGRNDDQVKIRGFRIELGEIEAKLAECEGVREAAVLAVDMAGDKRLVGYYTAQEALTVEQLRAHLSATLPEYMVPSAYIHLDQFPLTGNGKLDRKALPKPDSEAFGAREYVAPDGEYEEQMAAIWQDLLGIERVGRHDHFFDLGGHSLLAVRLATRVRDEFDVEVPLTQLFTKPTLAGFVGAVIDLMLAQFDETELLDIAQTVTALEE